MKLRLPSRLVQALLTTCAVAMTTSTPAFADVPSGYTPVSITDVDQLANYTASDYIAFIISTDITDNAHRMTGAHQYWTDNELHTHVLTFEEIESTSNGGVWSISSELVAVRMQELSFSHNATTSTYGEGGAIYGSSSSVITINDNGGVTFSENSASDCGGAIFGYSSSVITLNNNGSVTFNGNSALAGGAILTYGTLNMTKNGSVTFSGNSATRADGGAIYGYYTSAITFNDNESVTFSRNSADWGGAINASTSNVITFNDNGSVTFSGNSATASGGAICGMLVLTGNSSVTFSENTANCGGAIFANGTLNLTENDRVMFSGNSASTYGGAIYTYDTLNLTGNETVTFSGNSAPSNGGAIGVSVGTLNLTGNGHIVFQGNYEASSSSGSIYRLRSIFTSESILNISAGAGQDIVFYDTLYADSSSTVSFNAKYVDKDGVEREAMGDIVFSGKYAAEDLKKLKADYTPQELTDSLTTEVYATTNLYGGRLRVEDGAIYKGKGINVQAGSNAVLRLNNASLVLTGGIAVGNIANISGRQSNEISTSKGIDITEAKMKGMDGKGSLENVSLETSANYTIEDMIISGSLIDVGEGTTLYLVNVDIHSDTHITDEAAWLDMKATNGWLDKDNTQAVKEYSAEQDTTLFKSGDTGHSITLAAGTEIVELTSDMFDTVTMTGTDLWLDMTGIAEATYNKDYFTLDFKNLAHSLENARVDVDHLHVYATLDGERYTEAYSTANGGLTTTLYFAVPEPTTSTLSLLALAALAARRRRTW